MMIDGVIAWIGHNGGPPLDDLVPGHVPEWGENGIGTYFEWKRAHDGAWLGKPRSVVLFRLARAEQVGLTYREYVAEILDRGRYLQVEDAARVAEIKRARASDVAAPVPPTPKPDAGEPTKPLDFRRLQLAKLQRQRPRGR
jgi:hypothetical protein